MSDVTCEKSTTQSIQEDRRRRWRAVHVHSAAAARYAFYAKDAATNPMHCVFTLFHTYFTCHKVCINEMLCNIHIRMSVAQGGGNFTE